MKIRIAHWGILCLGWWFIGWNMEVSGKVTKVEPISVCLITSNEPSDMETLAVREIQRYLYLRTGQLVSISSSQSMALKNPSAIIVSHKNQPFLKTILTEAEIQNLFGTLQTQQFRLKTLSTSGQNRLMIVGGDELGTLYGAYRFIETLGVRFYLHGDVIPDEPIALNLPILDETGKPIFELRGIQPFHDFPEGPDWWNEDDYKAICSQLAKLRMNFLGLHTYPEEHPNAEPTVWIGLPQDVRADGTVTFSYPSSYMNTERGLWGIIPKRTRDYTQGSSILFERDQYGPKVMGNFFPEPKKLEDCNWVFNQSGKMLQAVFTYAHQLGIKTCVGTETPLTIPKRLQEYLKKMGKNPSDPAVVQELYEGMFTRAMRTMPLDYYWFWTREGWTWEGVSADEVQSVKNDILIAAAAAKKVKAPFTLATCGWVLGPPSDRALFDKFLPKEMPVSCINREVGKTPVEPGFAKVIDRPKWAIPWMEDDPALIQPQLWAGRMRADALDAKLYGCTGLMGIHWRTQVLAPNISALAWAAWDQSRWAPEDIEPPDLTKKEGPEDGQYKSIESDIEKTTDDPLYQTVRTDVTAYHFQVPNGSYSVTLKFCEPEYTAEGQRVFNVAIQDQVVKENVDIVKTAGAKTA